MSSNSEKNPTPNDEISAEDVEELLDEEDWDEDEYEDEDDGEEEEEELSLDQLSAAYAEVLQGRGDSPVEDSSANEPPQKPSRKRRKSRTEQEDPAHDLAASPISPKTILEAILFVGGPKEIKFSSRKIAALMRDVSPKEITQLVKELNQTYKKEKRAYHIVTNNGSIRLELVPEMDEVQRHFRGRNKLARLTQQAIDVLAIVAYNQPITRDQVDTIRVRPSGAILNQMVRRNLLSVEKTETKPVQKLFRTTDRFLDLFHLETIEDLPQTHDVSDLEELAD